MDLLLLDNLSYIENSPNIPKYLININEENCLQYIIYYWDKYVERFFLTINSKYNVITIFYIKNFLKKYEKKIIIINNDIENIEKKIMDYEIKDLLLLSNLSIIPNQKIEFDIINSIKTNDTYIFTHGNTYQYYFDKKNIESTNNNGNVIGLYLIKNYKKIETNKINFDKNIELYINQMNLLQEIKLDKLINYENNYKIKNISILFKNKKINLINNTLYDYKIENNKIFKKYKNDMQDNSIKQEILFYNYIQKYEKIKNLFPKLIHSYESGYLIEKNINFFKIDFTKNNLFENEEKIVNIFNKLNFLHNNSSINISKLEFYNNLKIEIHQSVINSIEIIKPILDNFPKFKKVNNIYVDSFEKIIEKCSKLIFSYYDSYDVYEYNLIHGNLYFNNILINDNKLLFTEPKGYYGKTQFYGLKEHDYSKILLSIYINNYFTIESISNKEICFDISKIEVSNIFIKKYFNKIHFMLMVLELFKLAQINKNDILTSIICYYYGLYLGTLL